MPPYKRSYIDVILAWVGRLPGAPWLWFAGITVVAMALGTGLSWADGSIPFGTFTVDRLVNDGYVVYPVFVMYYLNRTAAAALVQFRPALGELDAQYERIEYRLTTLPRPVAWTATALGLAYTGSSLAFNPAAYGFTPHTSPGSSAFFTFEAIFSGTFFVVFIVFAIRQLSVVVGLHRQATHLSIYETGSHVAFSQLTLRSSIFVALPVYVYTLIAVVTGRQGLDKVSVPDLIAIAAMVIGASVIFAWPLYGMHRRLVREKARRVLEVGRQFEVTSARLHTGTSAGDLAEMDAVGKQLAGLVLERDVVKKISTWPWETETLRGFLSSIALPIAIWIATTLLGKVLG